MIMKEIISNKMTYRKGGEPKECLKMKSIGMK